MKTHILRIRTENRDIFNAIKVGEKWVETRAASVKNFKMQTGDEVVFVCGSQKLQKTIAKAQIYKTIKAMLKDYKVKDIAPGLKTENELRDMYFSWPAYRAKIKKFGLIALELN